METVHDLTERNICYAQARYQKLSASDLATLRALTKEFDLDAEKGEIVRIESTWYVSHAGLLSIAAHRGCHGIHVVPVLELCHPELAEWCFKATVYPSETSRGFDGFGDATPENVGEHLRNAEMRIAETRAVSRALRKAYAVPLTSVEELGRRTRSARSPLRGQLNFLIRRYKLDGDAVKRYAAEYCGVSTLRIASRQQVTRFIAYLAESLKRDPDAIRCLLTGGFVSSSVA